MSNIFILSAVRSAIGDFGGALHTWSPTELGAAIAREAIARSAVAAEQIETSVFGNVIHTEPKDMYLSRVVAVSAGVPVTSPALTLNRLCGSGLQALVSGAEALQLGHATRALVGGAECMSRAGHLISSARFGTKLGDVTATDMMVGALNDPFGHGHMGITAENVAEDHDINRDMQDEFAATSHRRAVNAIENGYFADQILPLAVRSGRNVIRFDTDEHPRGDVTNSSLAKLRPAFKKDGTVTAGNASSINDGAAALVLSTEAALSSDSAPLARIVSTGLGGVDPRVMGLGPIPAVRQALVRAGLSMADMDVVESNEAFAAQACAVAQSLDLDPEKTNPNGGAIALGHPIGASGAIIMVKLIHELRRRGGKYGLATMCIGGGQGIAVVIEAC